MLIGAGKMGDAGRAPPARQRRRPPDDHQPHLRSRRRAGARLQRHAGAVRAVSPRYLPMADIVIGSTAATGHRADRADGPRGAARAQGRPMLLHRPRVPRNFDPAHQRSSTTSTSTTSTTSATVAEREPRRRAAARRTRRSDRRPGGRLVLALARGLEVVPTIVALREKMEAIRQRGAAEDARRAGRHRTARARRASSDDAAIVNKILHHPATTRASTSRSARGDVLRRGDPLALRRRGAAGRRARAPTCASARAAARSRWRRRSRCAGGSRQRHPGLAIETGAHQDDAAIACATGRCAPGRRQGAVRQGARGGAGDGAHRLRRALDEGRARPRSAPGLAIGAVPARDDARDVARRRRRGRPRRAGARAHGSAPQRPAARAAARAASRPRRSSFLRGNVDTRLGKLERGEVDALVLAAAGLPASASTSPPSSRSTRRAAAGDRAGRARARVSRG